jgi:hypothetical protein
MSENKADIILKDGGFSQPTVSLIHQTEKGHQFLGGDFALQSVNIKRSLIGYYYNKAKAAGVSIAI